MLIEVVASLLDRFGDHPIVAGGARPHPGDVRAVTISHRWVGRAVLLLFRPQDRSPWVVAKVDRHRPYIERLVLEDATLRQLRTVPEVSGLVPEPIGIAETPWGTVLFQSAVPGTPLSVAIRRRLRDGHRRAANDHEEAVAWFQRMRDWSDREERSGRLPAPPPIALDLTALRDEVAEAVPETVATGPALRDLAAAARGIPVQQVRQCRVHGDPGPGNLVYAGRRRALGLIDWESGTGPHSPLPDALTFVNHYARVTPIRGRPPTRRVAVERAVLGDDHLGELSRSTWRRLIAGSGPPAELAGLLVVRTLLDLAIGRTGTAHSQRGRAMWRDLLVHVVDRLNADPRGRRRLWDGA